MLPPEPPIITISTEDTDQEEDSDGIIPDPPSNYSANSYSYVEQNTIDNQISPSEKSFPKIEQDAATSPTTPLNENSNRLHALVAKANPGTERLLRRFLGTRLSISESDLQSPSYERASVFTFQSFRSRPDEEWRYQEGSHLPAHASTSLPPAELMQLISALEEKAKEQKKVKGVFTRVLSAWNRDGVKHLLLLLVLILYNILGAALFQAIENPTNLPEEKLLEQSSVLATSSTKQNEANLYWIEQQIINRIKFVLNSTMTPLCDESTTTEVIRNLDGNYEKMKEKNELLTAYVRYGRQITTFWKGCLYSATVYSAIGYGNLVCHTTAGRLVTIFYSAVGIPLLVCILKAFGDLFHWGLKKIWSEMPYTSSKLQKMKEDSHASNKFSDHVAPRKVPVSMAVTLFTIFILVSAGSLTCFAHFDYFTAVYFLFSSVTTIGLGDVTADLPEMAVFSFAMIFIGMCCLSMCCSLLAEKIENHYLNAMEILELVYEREKPNSMMRKKKHVIRSISDETY